MEDLALAQFSFAVTKVSVDKSEGGLMRWRAVASDTAPDLYSEKMSVELFDDFVGRIEAKSTVPEPFTGVLNEDWRGGMPYLSISHYKSGTSGKNVPGMPEKIYRDGDRLKAVGILHNNDLGRAVFKSLCDDLYTEKAKENGKIRISIGFLDLEHTHAGEGKSPDYVFTRSGLTDPCPKCAAGVGNKTYTKGQLVHLALTRVPVNPRTDMEVSKGMAITTQKDDAESIVHELSDLLEEKSLVVASEALVIKSDSESIEEKAKVVEDEGSSSDDKEDEAEMKKKHDKMNMKSVVVEKKKIASDKQSEELTYDEPDEEKREERRNRPAGERSMLEKSFVSLEAKITELKSLGTPAETALAEIQPLFDAFGEQVKKSFAPASSETAQNNSATADLINAVRSLAENMSTFQQTISTELATLKAQVATKPLMTNQSVPEPRSINAKSIPAARDESKPLSIKEIAYRSTFS